MRRRARHLPTLAGLLVSVLGLGCQMEGDSVASVQRPSVCTDPCAERLHDLCGQLLLYHATQGRLPKSLQELSATGDGSASELVCPESGLAYIYEPEGLRLTGQSGLLVVYDATPCHSGMRWGIFLDETGKGDAMARVVLLPEDALQAAADGP